MVGVSPIVGGEAATLLVPAFPSGGEASSCSMDDVYLKRQPSSLPLRSWRNGKRRYRYDDKGA